MNESNSQESYELSIGRVIEAAREKVFRAWTDPEVISTWWGPNGFTTPYIKVDLRPGGAFDTVMHGPDGTEYPGKGVFLEVSEPERLVFTDAFTEGWQPATPFMTTIVTFEESEGKTTCLATIRHWSAEDKAKHEEMGFQTGWGEMMDRLVVAMESAG